MTDKLRIALAQLNPTVGALGANLALGKAAIADAVAAGADILMFSELFLTGYFPDDLLFKPQFITDAMAAAGELAAATKGTDVSVILPTVWRENGNLFNALVLCEQGEIVATRYKRELPNDDIFYVIAGTARILVGDEWIDAAPGSFVRVAAGVTHDFANATDEPVGLLNIYVPGGFERDMPAIVDWYARSPEAGDERA